MKKQYFLFALITLLSIQTAFAQYKWWDPAKENFPVIQGQGWPKEVSEFYDRLPGRMKKLVNPSVWEMSQDPAGLTIRFYSNASALRVRYTVTRKLSLPHIPATGKSGVDLYAIDRNGNWEWCPGGYNFGDTIEYHFNSLKLSHHNFVREYCLYLPYYNHVTWLEIGVPEQATMKPVPISKDKPIVIYGTSIAQGTAAPRPGLTWPAILGRRLHTPVINLGFAGCGRLDKPVIDLMTKLNAKIYVLACLPNLVGRTKVIKTRLIYAVKTLQEKRPGVPILIVDHADANVSTMNTSRDEKFNKTNDASRETFTQLKAAGVKNIYYLSADSIGLNYNDLAIDGVHPNAGGEIVYAKAYERTIRKILHETAGQYTTMQPRKQFRDRTYDWNARHRVILQANKENPPRIALLGNSIVQHWGGKLDKTIHRGTKSWEKYFAPVGVRSFGFGGDEIQNLLWRVYHGALDGYKADQVIIMIGTNNLGENSNREIVSGLKFLIKAIKYRQPSAKMLMVGILPRREMEQRVAVLDKQIAWMCSKTGVRYIDPGKLLLDSSGEKINSTLFIRGGLHPDAAGYQILAKAIEPYLVAPKK